MESGIVKPFQESLFALRTSNFNPIEENISITPFIDRNSEFKEDDQFFESNFPDMMSQEYLESSSIIDRSDRSDKNNTNSSIQQHRVDLDTTQEIPMTIDDIVIEEDGFVRGVPNLNN